MKKYRWFTLAMVVSCLMFPVSADAAKVIGKIDRLKGTAYIYRQAVSEPIKAYLGIPVQLQDRIKTQTQSRLRIELIDGSILSLGENGDLDLKEFYFSQKEKKQKALIKVVLGKLRVFVRNWTMVKDMSFQVHTPTAVAGVRGTVFLVWVKSREITQVVCFQNVVEVANIYDPTDFVRLTKNLATDIVSKKAPTKPVLMTEEQLNQLQKDLEPVAIPAAPTEEAAAEEVSAEEEVAEEVPAEEEIAEEAPAEEAAAEEPQTEEAAAEEASTEETTIEAVTTEETPTEETTTGETPTEATITEQETPVVVPAVPPPSTDTGTTEPLVETLTPSTTGDGMDETTIVTTTEPPTTVLETTVPTTTTPTTTTPTTIVPTTTTPTTTTPTTTTPTTTSTTTTTPTTTTTTTTTTSTTTTTTTTTSTTSTTTSTSTTTTLTSGTVNITW